MVTSYALVVPLREGERARQLVATLGIGRADLKLGRRDGNLLIPIQEPVETPIPEARVEVAEFVASRPPGNYKDRVEVPPELRTRLPSSFDIVGDLVVIKIPRELAAHAAAIGRAILDAHPNVRGVFQDQGVQGEHRLRTLRPLAGEHRTRTVHSEYGARFHVDLSVAYFSPRLANEHHRVAEAVRPGETFVDATAGVGPFCVLAAMRRRAQRIVAVDTNPAALGLLRENLIANRVSDRVETVLGDARDEFPRLRPFHRAAINLPHSGEGLLRAAWRTIEPGGIVHYYAILDEATMARDVADLARRLREDGPEALLLDTHVVHAYSPTERAVAIDIQAAPRR